VKGRQGVYRLAGVAASSAIEIRASDFAGNVATERLTTPAAEAQSVVRAEALPMPDRVPGSGDESALVSTPQRTYADTAYVKLPIEIEPKYRVGNQGLVLYVKEGPKGDWRRAEHGNADLTEFLFHARHDGEYWFRVVAVDQQGRSQPSDLNRDLQDAVVVVVNAHLSESLAMPELVVGR